MPGDILGMGGGDGTKQPQKNSQTPQTSKQKT